MYNTIKPLGRQNIKQMTSLLAKGGENKRDLAQLLDPNFAQVIKNYVLSVGNGNYNLEKRKGYTVLSSEGDPNPISAMAFLNDDVIIICAADVTYSYTISTDTWTTIKDDWTTDDPFSIVKYGDYVLLCNGGNKIHYIKQDLSIAELTNSPKAKVLYVANKRLFAGNLDSGSYKLSYSGTDDGSDPMWTTWTAGTLATDPGGVIQRQVGAVTSITSLGENIIVFGENGKYAFQIVTLDVGGNLNKTETEVMSRIDFGGARNSIVTNKGLFYINNSGLYQLVSVGQSNVPFSDQENLTSTILGAKLFDELDFTNADMVFDYTINTLYVTCAKNSSVNNYIIAYNTDLKAFFHFTGWNVNCFLQKNGVIYGGDALETVIYKLFDGYSDNGIPIFTEFTQEVNIGSLSTSKDLQGQYIQGWLSDSSNVQIHYDIYNEKGEKTSDKLVLNWTKDGALSGYGITGYSAPYTSGYGGTTYPEDTDMTETFSGGKFLLRNISRLIVRITSSDELPHAINWFSLITKEKGQIRRRNLTK